MVLVWKACGTTTCNVQSGLRARNSFCSVDEPARISSLVRHLGFAVSGVSYVHTSHHVRAEKMVAA